VTIRVGCLTSEDRSLIRNLCKMLIFHKVVSDMLEVLWGLQWWCYYKFSLDSDSKRILIIG